MCARACMRVFVCACVCVARDFLKYCIYPIGHYNYKINKCYKFI